MTGDRAGSLIAAVFGLTFALANAGALPRLAASLLQGIAFAFFVAIVLVLRRRSSRAGAHGRALGRGDGLIVAAELAAIVLGLLVLTGPLDAEQAAVAWISLVVGVHLVVLAIIWRQPLLRGMGSAIALCGAAGLVPAATGATDAAIAVTAGPLPGTLLLASSLVGETSGRGRSFV